MMGAKGVFLGAVTTIVVLGSSTLGPGEAACDATDPSASDSVARRPTIARDAGTTPGLESLVPALADHPYRMEPGLREFNHRLSVSPGYGFFGSDRLFAVRVTYNPEAWLGYEASIGHDPGHAVHAVLHTLSAIVRRPLPGRLQPYASGGYGMVIVFPGQAVNAAPVTKNTLAFGGGLELYLRNDLAVRTDLRQAVVFGKQRDREGIVAYDYLQGTIGLAFYRSIQP